LAKIDHSSNATTPEHSTPLEFPEVDHPSSRDTLPPVVAKSEHEETAPVTEVIFSTKKQYFSLVAKDPEAYMAIFGGIRNGSTMAMRDAEDAGRLLRVANGTRAIVLKDAGPILKGMDVRVLRVRLTSGAHEGEEAICMSSTIKDFQ
jgi:hypothetical protein